MGRKRRKHRQQADAREAARPAPPIASSYGHLHPPGCTCPATGGFAEALPDDVWRAMLREAARCPIHGKGR